MVVFRLLAASALVSLVGCGGSSVVLQSNDAGSEAATDAVVDVADAADAPSTPQNAGSVSLTSTNGTTWAPPTESSMVSAAFTLAAPAWCTSGPLVDGCSIRDCKPPATPSTDVSAGVVLVTGGKQPLSLTPKKAAYPSGQSQLRLWDGGEALQVIAAGDVAPTFSLSLIAPAYVLVDAPVWPTGGAALSIPRANDLDVSWSGGGAGSVDVSLVLGGTNGSVATVAECRYPAQSGFGKVSAKVLGMLPASTPDDHIEIISLTYVNTTVSDWLMTFTAVATANTPTGAASARLVLQ